MNGLYSTTDWLTTDWLLSGTRGVFSGDPSEDLRLADRGAAAVARRRDRGRGTAGREQAGHRRAVGVQHARLGVGGEPAEREAGVDRLVPRQVDRAERRRAQGCYVLCGLVEQRVLAALGARVVERHRRLEAAGRETELALELLDRLRGVHLAAREYRPLEALVVEHEPHAAVLLQQRDLAGA